MAINAVNGGAAWNRDGVILFSPTRTSGLHRISEAGGVPSLVTSLDTARGDLTHYYPQFLPDSEHFLYFVGGSQSENNGIYIGSLSSGESVQLLNTQWRAAYSPPGYLLFLQDTMLMAQPIDVQSLELTGEPVVVTEGVWRNTDNSGRAGFSVSSQGVLAYLAVESAQVSELTWFDRDGRYLGTVGLPADYYTGPQLSPDGTRVAIDIEGPRGSLDIWLLELDRDVPTRLTAHPATERFPLWSPDGSRIVFHSNRNTGIYDLFEIPSSGVGNAELLFASSDRKYPRDWSRDGRYLVYTTFGMEPDATNDLWVLPLSGQREAYPFLESEFHESQGQFSPDGRLLAYASDQSGRPEVYISSFPRGDSRIRVSTDGGVQPRWRGDGKELYYLQMGADKLMAAEIIPEPTLRVGSTRELFQVPLASNFGTPASQHNYDVAADGQRFLMSVRPENATVPITVILNWTAALGR